MDLNRRQFLATSITALGLIISGCESDNPAEQEIPPVQIKFTSELESIITPEQKEAIATAVNDYIETYGSAQKTITLSSTHIPPELQPNHTTTTEEIATPGNITFNTHWVENTDLQTLRFTTLHAMTHATKSSEISEIKFELEPNVQVIGVNGFEIKVLLNGDTTSFFLIEEGVAEFLAHGIDQEYTVSNQNYFRVGSFTISKAGEVGITPSEVYTFLINNNLVGFARVILGEQGSDKELIRKLVQEYQVAWNGPVEP